ncbi:alpha/beta fold hydrolase [Candidatus Uabimicrobium sp. HlEnr_7]|uniref:alpha/beta fold hydrolase n=1 Tax=Candidatus Uabimicrobium helgolandensis TaxID=3095367 RepID=UPI0035591F37
MNIENWKNRGHFFTYKNNDIFFVDEGQGDVIVCIHGFPTSSWDWNLLWEELTTHYRVIAIDMIGFGYSDKPKNYEYSIADQANLHEELLVNLDIKAAHVLAHDYGDTVAQELLARGKFLHFSLQSVCLLNGGLFAETHRPRRIQSLLAGNWGFIIKEFLSFTTFKRSFVKIFGAETQPTDKELRDFWRLIEYKNGHKIAHKLIRYMKERKIHRDRWVQALINAKFPLKLINGAADPVSGAHMVKRYEELVTHENIALLQGIGHYPQLENPERVLDEFLSFIQNT